MYNHTCLQCQKQFSDYDKIKKYCGNECYNIHRTNDYNLKCNRCSKEFRGRLYKGKLSKFCSKLCFYSYCNDPEKLFNSMNNNYERHVVRNGNECWGWNGPFAKHGYALARFNRKVRYASKISWMIHNGVDSIPKGIFVLHKCDNPICSNPAHLFLGTPKDNMQDKIKKGRSNAPTGDKHYNAKLTEDQVRDIRLRLASGQTGNSISILYKVTRSTISAIRCKKLWNNLI